MAGAISPSRLVAALLVLQSLLLAWGAWCQSPTVDETAYLPAGIWNWVTGQFGLARVSPPLARLVAAGPLLILESPKVDWRRVDTSAGRRTEHEVGRDYLRANGRRVFWHFTLARWACIPFSILGGWVCYRWATDLYGPVAGILAVILWCFSPGLLAHGQLVTPDMAVTAFGVASSYAFWRWLRRPCWSLAIANGLLLGICLLSKTSGIILLASWPLLWVVDRWIGRRCLLPTGTAKECVQLGMSIALSIVVLNAGYLFQGAGTPLGEFNFVSEFGMGEPRDTARGRHSGNRFADTWISKLPVPLPLDYVLGLDLQRKAFESKLRSYLGGTFKEGGWWYYYLYGLAVKVPLGTCLLVLLALVAPVFIKGWHSPWRDEICLLVPLLAILVVASSETGFSHHMRYILPIVPFAIILISKVGGVSQLSNVVSVLTAVATAWMIASSLYVYPHSLSFFNELAGGPRCGHNYLINSNIDWGQDLLYLRAWLERHPETAPLRLAYYGECSPRLAEIAFELPPQGTITSDPAVSVESLPPGWYAVSVNYLRGHEFPVHDGQGNRQKLNESAFVYFRRLTPAALAGYSIYVYHVSNDHEGRLHSEP